MRNRTPISFAGLTLALGLTLGMASLQAEPEAPGRPAAGPANLFDRLAGGKAVWVRAEISEPHLVGQFDRIAERVGVTDGRLTRAQYEDYLAQRRADRKAGSPPPVPAKLIAPEPSTRTTGSNTPDVMDRWAEALFRQHDRNGDGLLDFDELPEALRAERARWDTNGDGFIDLAEFKRYFRARREQVLEVVARQDRQTAHRAPAVGLADLDVGPPAGSASPPATPGTATAPAGAPAPAESEFAPDEERDGKEPAEPRPFVARYGKLPADIPAWFGELDTDRDGQVSLYEWRVSGRPVAEFQRMDRNNDGFLTVEEVRFFEKHVRLAVAARR